MTPHVVVDVGNTRVKWGLVAPGKHSLARMASLPEDEETWQAEVASWALPRPATWAMASVRPARSERLAAWVAKRGDVVVRLDKPEQLPLRVELQRPDLAGIDRLLNAVAARRHLEPGRGAVLIGAGSAVTADWFDEEHAFRGGVIFPGFGLMAKSLNDYAALLPLVQVTHPVPPPPGGDTLDAMRAGIFLAVSGGVREAVSRYTEQAKRPPRVFLTGGDAPLLARAMGLLDGERPTPWNDFLLWPEQTLLGVLDSAEAMP